MSIQYSDTHFSEIMPFDKAFARFQECLETGIPVQALHVGTIPEIKARQNEIIRRADMQQQIDDIKEQLKNMAISPTPKLLHIPTVDDVERFAKEI